MPKKTNRSCKGYRHIWKEGKMLSRRYVKHQFVRQARRSNKDPRNFDLTPKLQASLDWDL